MSDYTRIGPFYTKKRLISVIDLEDDAQARQEKSYSYVKRAFDIGLSLLLMILVLSWLAPLLASLIRLDSKGGSFFRQKRVGKNGRLFTCYKFRTMFVNEEADSRQATSNDPRITRIGRWLRHSNLDELPQLVNVLLGDMSIVGPRPHMPADCERFAALITDYHARHQVKPGITGLAQVKGYHGPTPDYESVFRRYQWDAYYIRYAGIWLDIRILFSTVARRSEL